MEVHYFSPYIIQEKISGRIPYTIMGGTCKQGNLIPFACVIVLQVIVTCTIIIVTSENFKTRESMKLRKGLSCTQHFTNKLILSRIIYYQLWTFKLYFSSHHHVIFTEQSLSN